MRITFGFLALAAIGLLAAGAVHASPFQYTDDVLNGVTLSEGHYDATLDLSGTVWQKKLKRGNGWDPSDRITATAYLDGAVVGSGSASGMSGQFAPFDLKLNFSADAKDQSSLQFAVTGETSSKRERFSVTNAVLSGDYTAPVPPVVPQNTNGSGGASGPENGGGGSNGPNEETGQPHSVPEPSTLIGLSVGLAALALGRRRLFK